MQDGGGPCCASPSPRKQRQSLSPTHVLWGSCLAPHGWPAAHFQSRWPEYMVSFPTLGEGWGQKSCIGMRGEMFPRSVGMGSSSGQLSCCPPSFWSPLSGSWTPLGSERRRGMQGAVVLWAPEWPSHSRHLLLTFPKGCICSL